MNAIVTSASASSRGVSAPAAGTSVGHWLARVGTTIWKAFEASGQERARREMLQFADHCESLQPSLAAELRAAGARASQV